VDNAFCRLVNSSGNKEIARYTLSGGGTQTAMIMAKLYRHNNEWKMHALGDPANGKVVVDIFPNIKAIL
jgi:tellurium resistance protein TerZ